MSDLTQDQLKKLLTYDPLTGVFTWLNPPRKRVKPGSIAGCVFKPGYAGIRICILGRAYLASRLAWLYTYGAWPKKDVDHINGDAGNNRIANLREATRTENNRNQKIRKDNVLGLRGVSWDGNKKWRSRISCNGIAIYLGDFYSPEAASAAYEAKATELFGEFKRK